MPQLSVHLLPALFAEDEVADDLVVIVDILRASTTITHAIANGAEKVVPLGSIDDAFALRDQHNDVILGGERGGIRVEGFDYGNSPTDYSAAHVGGRTVGFTTTNGTKALLRSQRAAEIVIGCFANLSVLVEHLQAQSRPVHVVCAGTDGRVTGEDVLFAGAVVARLGQVTDGNDEARLAADHWRCAVPDETSAQIETSLRQSQGGRNLIRLGYESDIALAAQVDTVPVLSVVRDGCLWRA